MKNFEKYIDVIIEDYNLGTSLLCALAHIRGDKNSCSGIRCRECVADSLDWLKEEYKEPCLLSHAEYVILRNLPIEYKWIGRDSNTIICVYKEKPYKEWFGWTKNYPVITIDVFNHLFQFIKWEDEEPYEITKLIEDYEKEHSNA